ncbi:MAG: aminomethyl-transferring glycine dehydrogenase subunit GcvPB [Methanobacteriota archaeon]|nr:MAG: aminomethyl-transferring glycine dehydrogenase subunit GcvPB [Euryarchaeota archaeon]
MKDTRDEDELIENILPDSMLRKKLDIPNLHEFEVTRHYTRLSQMNFGVDTGIYPLGSCTMKYTPKLGEVIVRTEEATQTHPLQNEAAVQGSLQIMYELQEMLCKIGGVDAVSLQPAAGAHCEFTGLLMARQYHELNGDKRDEVILPDTSHGTNPASASMMGYRVIEIPSKDGRVDLDALENAAGERTAAFMLTNPNTLGIFEDDVLEIARIVHDSGAILYYDGANLNAVMGKTTPGKMNFDIVHFNLHKTFSTPHGGGGPGAGPIGVMSRLMDFLPSPVVAYDGQKYFLDYDIPKSVGKVRSFYGSFAVLLRAYVYIKMLGSDGLEWVAERSVLNSNYLKERLKDHLDMPFKDLRKHEFVLSGAKLKERGLTTKDLAKRLMDYGFHPPTVYFPQIVEEALMIEPTETENKETLDAFADAIISILGEDREKVAGAPYDAAVGRVDEVNAARNPILSWKMLLNEE